MPRALYRVDLALKTSYELLSNIMNALKKLTAKWLFTQMNISSSIQHLKGVNMYNFCFKVWHQC